MGYMSNKATETPTHFCWTCKGVFIMDAPYSTTEKCLKCKDSTLVAYYDPPPTPEKLLEDVPLAYPYGVGVSSPQSVTDA